MELWTFIVAVMVGISALAGAIKAWPTVWTFTKKFARAIGQAPDAAENLAKVVAQADLILAEFSPNGGGLREAVNRLDQALAEILTWQTSHTGEDLAQNLAVQTKLAETLDLIIERTSVLPDGAIEAKPLSIYTQDRMHDLLNSITGVIGHIPLIHERLKRLEQTLATEHLAVEASQVETRVKVAEVFTQVKTMNDLTVGQMADADERRRIIEIDPGDRTAADVQHLEDTEGTT